MFKNIIQKLSIWSLSFILVVTFLFVDIKIDFNQIINKEKVIGEYKINTLYDSPKPQFQRIDFVNIEVSDLVIQPKASLLATVVFYTVFSVFLSMGAYYAGELIISSVDNFMEYYEDKWTSVPQSEQATMPGSPWYINAYLNATGQNNITDPEKIVLPKNTMKAIYEEGDWFINHSYQNDSSWIKFKSVNYINSFGQSKMQVFPSVNSQTVYSVKQYSIGAWTGKFLVYTYPANGTDYFILNDDVLPSVQKVSLGNGIYRLKLITRLRSDPLVHTYTKWTQDLTFEQIEMLDTAHYFELVFNSGFRLLPFFNNQDMNYNFSNMYRFSYDDATDQTSSFYNLPNSNRDYVVALDSTNTYSESGGLDLADDDSWVVGYPGDNENDYWEIPYPDTTNPEPKPPVPVPVENQDPWVYNPPNPGTGAVDMDWTDLTNPTTPAPTATAENTLSGGIFQALGDWFVSVFFGAINAMMGFFKALGINLISMLQSLIDTWTALIPEGWYTNFWTEFADSMTGLFVPNDLDLKFNDLMDFFEQKLGLLLYPLQVITDIFNRFANVSGIDRITFNEFWLMGYLLIPSFYIDFGDMMQQYSWLGYIFGLIKIFFTSLLIFQFLVFLYGTYESMRDA